MLLDDISDFLVGNGLGAPVQKAQLVELPDTALALRETGGFPTEHRMGTTNGNGRAILDQPTLQVVTRAKDYPTAMSLARLAYQILDGARDQTINGLLYHFIRALQQPFFLMRDDNQRYLCAFNIHITRRNV